MALIDDILEEMQDEQEAARQARKPGTIQDDWYDAARIQGLPKEWADYMIKIERKGASGESYEQEYKRMKDIELLYFGEPQ